MARVKRAVNAHKKRRTILKASKGYRGQRSRLYRKAKEQQLHSLNYAYRDRRARKHGLLSLQFVPPLVGWSRQRLYLVAAGKREDYAG